MAVPRATAFSLLILGLVFAWTPQPAATQAMEGDAGFLAASARWRAEIARLDADPARADEMFALEAQARADLKARLQALLGPLSFEGLQPAPVFAPDSLFADTQTHTFGTPEGLLFRDADDATRIFVTSEPVLDAWVRRAARMKGAPPEFAHGLPAAMTSEMIASSLLQGFEAFVRVRSLHLPIQPGETVLALYGYLGPDTGPHLLPNAILVAWLADGRFVAGLSYLPGDETPDSPICATLYDQLRAKLDEMAGGFIWPSAADLAQVERARMEAEDSFQECVAREAPRQPAFGKVVSRASALLATMRAEASQP